MVRRTIGRVVTVAVWLTMGLSVRASEKVRWDQLVDSLASQSRTAGIVENRNVTVITLDARLHHTRRLVIDADGVKLTHGKRQMESLPRRDVSQIEIRQRGRYFPHIAQNAKIDGIAFLIPPKTFEIAP